MEVVLRTSGAPLDLVRTARESVHAMDPVQALSNVRPLEELVDRSTATPLVPGKRATLVDPKVALRSEETLIRPTQVI